MMDQHFSFDIAKYTKSNYILVGFNLYTALDENGLIHQKVRGSILSHSEPEMVDGQPQIKFFNLVLSWNLDFYNRAGTEDEKNRFITVIKSDNIVNYELFSAKMMVAKKALVGRLRV